MASKLFVACCFLVIFSVQAYSHYGIDRFFAELLKDESEKPECLSFEDQQPDMCEEMVRLDKGYCADWGHEKFCERTCSPCGPKEKKAPGPAGACEDKRADCKGLMARYRLLFGHDACKTQELYVYKYCRHYCSLC